MPFAHPAASCFLAIAALSCASSSDSPSGADAGAHADDPTDAPNDKSNMTDYSSLFVKGTTTAGSEYGVWSLADFDYHGVQTESRMKLEKNKFTFAARCTQGATVVVVGAESPGTIANGSFKTTTYDVTTKRLAGGETCGVSVRAVNDTYSVGGKTLIFQKQTWTKESD